MHSRSSGWHQGLTRGRGAKDTVSGGAAGSRAAWALGQFSSGKWWSSSWEGIEKLTGHYLFTGTATTQADCAWWEVIPSAAAFGVSAPQFLALCEAGRSLPLGFLQTEQLGLSPASP